MSKTSVITAVSWIIAFMVCIATVSKAVPECRDINHGRSCSLSSNAETVAVFDDQLLVGAADHLYSFRRDLSFRESVDIGPQEDKFTKCTKFGGGGLANTEAECRNFLRVIQSVPNGFETNTVDESQIMVCGTNAFFPKCTIHDSSSLSNYSFMTTEDSDKGYSPSSNSDPIVAILASNGRFFTATNFQAFQQQRTIGMAQRPLGGDSLFRVKAPTSEPQWLNKPDFVSAYEIGNHIYFFLQEPAYEVDNGQSIVYSRVIRICKNDDGYEHSSGSFSFLTYQKARMKCSEDGDTGSIPYDYDNLESTFLWRGSSQAILYGIFSSPSNGPQGSAICKFSFDQTVEGSLTKVFEDGDYSVENEQQVWVREEPGPFSCPGTTGTQRTPQQADRYQLVDSPVLAMEPEPLHVVSGEKLDKIAVDVISYNNMVQEVVYFTTEGGKIHQVVHVTGTETAKYEHVIRNVGSTVSYLNVYRNGDETRQVYATTEDQIMTISRGDCTQYNGCFECLDSKDAYCGWSQSSSSCVSKLTPAQSPSELTEAHSASEEAIVMLCGTRPYVPDPSPVVPTTTSCPLPPQPTNTRDTTTPDVICPPKIDGLGVGDGDGSDSSKTDMDIPTIVGATVGAFVLGVPVGAFVCFIFFRLFIQPRRSKESNSTRHTHSISTNGGPLHGNMSQVNNLQTNGDSSDQNYKKDLSLSESAPHPPGAPPRYVNVQPKTHPPNTTTTPSTTNSGTGISPSTTKKVTYNGKDVSVMMEDNDSAFADENDVVPPLMSAKDTGGSGTYKKHSKQLKHSMSAGANGVARKQVPGYGIPKGRTPSTTWLREGSVSECSDLSSPLESPISDV